MQYKVRPFNPHGFLYAVVGTLTSMSSSCLKRELGRHLPTVPLNCSMSPALTPSLSDERSKVVSMAVTLGCSVRITETRVCVCVCVCECECVCVCVSRGVARISARGFPKSLGNKGAGEWCATRARILAVR